MSPVSFGWQRVPSSRTISRSMFGAGLPIEPGFGSMPGNVPARIGDLIALAAAAYGVFAFIKRQFPMYMFRQSMFVFFDFSEPRVFFFIDYAAVMVLFALAGYLIMKGLERSSAVRQRI